MKSSNGINLTMLCDFYELTMGNGYFAEDMQDTVCYFDVFYRSVPDEGGYAICAALDRSLIILRTLSLIRMISII